MRARASAAAANYASECDVERRNVVIAAGFGMPARDLYPFMHTFYTVGLSMHAEALLLVKVGHPDSKRRLQVVAKGFGLGVVAPEEDYPFLEATHRLNLSSSNAVLSMPHTARYAHAFAALRGRKRCFDKVLLTDARDVYFQADPFVHVSQPALYVTQEQVRHGGTKADDCCYVQTNEHNRRWLNDVAATAAGAMLAKYGGKTPILCSGITLGTTDAVLNYLRHFVVSMSRLKPPLHAGRPMPTLNAGLRSYHVALLSLRDAPLPFPAEAYPSPPLRRSRPGASQLPCPHGPAAADDSLVVLTNEDGPVFHNVCWDPKIRGLQVGLPRVRRCESRRRCHPAMPSFALPLCVHKPVVPRASRPVLAGEPEACDRRVWVADERTAHDGRLDGTSVWQVPLSQREAALLP